MSDVPHVCACYLCDREISARGLTARPESGKMASMTNDIDPTDTFDIELADPMGGNEPKARYRVITGTMVDGVVTESTETLVDNSEGSGIGHWSDPRFAKVAE